MDWRTAVEIAELISLAALVVSQVALWRRIVRPDPWSPQEGPSNNHLAGLISATNARIGNVQVDLTERMDKIERDQSRLERLMSNLGEEIRSSYSITGRAIDRVGEGIERLEERLDAFLSGAAHAAEKAARIGIPDPPKKEEGAA